MAELLFYENFVTALEKRKGNFYNRNNHDPVYGKCNQMLQDHYRRQRNIMDKSRERQGK